MVSFAMNPFFSSDGSFDISGTVGGLSLTGLDGLIIPVSNLKENIEVNPLFPNSHPLFPYFFLFPLTNCHLLSLVRWTQILVVFVTLDNGLTLPVVVMEGFVWCVEWNNKYFCLSLKRRHFILPLNECKNSNGCGNRFQITVIPKHNVKSDFIIQPLYLLYYSLAS